MGKPKAPKPDPAIGQAAMASAQQGQDYLNFMKEQAGITNQWAAEDRARYTGTFQPLQDQYIKDAQEWASPDRMAARVGQAQAGVQTQVDNATGTMNRSMEAMGVNPNSGRFAATNQTAGLQGALAVAGAGNVARRDVRNEAETMRANAINMGNGLPAQALGAVSTANGAAGSGFQGAMQGYGQQGSLLNSQFSNQMDVYNAKMNASSGLWSGIGSLVGLAFGSDENTKKDIKKPGRSLLDAVDKMPIKDWTYKEGHGDGGNHIGTMSQDFKKATGKGDGKTINVIDAIGTTMGAVQELHGVVKDIQRTVRSLPGVSAGAPKSKPRGIPADMRMAA